MVSQLPHPVIFADLTLDLPRGRLLRNGADIRLRAKSFALLEFLVLNRGRVISKDELLTALWPDVTVTEDSLTRCIHEVRRALGDQASALLQTVPRRGYIFAAADDKAERPALVANDMPDEIPQPDKTPAPLRHDGIAVLRFDLSGPPNAADQVLLDGLGHDIIGRLARLRSFHVIARGSSFARGIRSCDPQAAGQALGVAYVLAGRAKFDGPEVTLEVELVDSSGGQIVWTDSFSAIRTGFGELLHDVTDRLTHAIQREITHAERNRSLSVALPSLDGWQAYHRGLFHMLQFTDSELQSAEGFFQLSLDRDPAFSRAHAAMSYCHFLEAFLRPPDQRGDKAVLALRAASRAMQLDDQSPASRWAYGRALWLGGDQAGGIREMRTSVELSPSFAMGHQSLSFFLFQSGTPAESIACADRAESLSPFDPFLCAIYGARAMALWRQGEVEAAAEFALKAARQPNVHKHILAISVMVLTAAGRLEAANHCMDQVRGFDPGYSLDKFKGAFSGLSEDALSIVHQVAPRLGLR
jgi:DNA-binding winged helix-turn-helix (wHTH) protein